ncbi:hypothetical protein D3C81_1845310 [compost metagenome]
MRWALQQAILQLALPVEQDHEVAAFHHAHGAMGDPLLGAVAIACCQCATHRIEPELLAGEPMGGQAQRIPKLGRM